MLASSLQGGNPLRKDMPISPIDLLFLDITSRFSGIANNKLCYNDVVKFVRTFAANMPEFARKFSEITVKVKFDTKGQTLYTDKSTKPPNVFLRDKSVHQRISICGKRIDGSLEDIILIPFMYGCEWCITAGLSPEQLHALGEDASYVGCFFIKDGSPKYFLAHEKIAHNLITTCVYNGVLKTSLKTQDEKNNSIEMNVVKKRGSYRLLSTSFDPELGLEVLDVVKQIYVFLTRGNVLYHKDATQDMLDSVCEKSSFKAFVRDLVHFTALELERFIVLEVHELEPTPAQPEGAPSIHPVVLKPSAETIEKSLEALFANDDIRSSHTLGSPLCDLMHYPQLIVESIFPSIKSYEKKALFLTKMLTSYILTEHEIVMPSDRDNLGLKSYLIAAELMKRDLTMNGGERLKQSNKLYDPSLKTETGDSDAFETLEQTKLFKSLSDIMTFSTPMSTHSKCMGVREVNGSHTGFKCFAKTPSGAKIGLVTSMAVSCCVSRTNSKQAVMNLIQRVMQGKLRFSKGQKTISLNSMPFTTATHAEYTEIKRLLKTSPTLYDVAFVPEIYTTTTQEGEVQAKVVSYNILCDGGRLYRPLFVTSKLLSLQEKSNPLSLTKPDQSLREVVNAFVADKTLEELIALGFVEMVFAIELSYHIIAESIESLEHGLKQASAGLAPLAREEFTEINPVALCGTNASCAPLFNHNPAGRGIHETALASAALTPGGTNMSLVSESSSKLLLTTERACVSTLHNELYSRHYGNGVNVMMMIKITDTNIEDSLTVSSNFAKTVIIQASNTIEIEVEQGVKVGIPPTLTNANKAKYHAIHNDTNLPVINSELKVGDCLFALYRLDKVPGSVEGEEDVEVVNLSKFVERGKEGRISKFKVLEVGNKVVYRITISSYRPMEEGNKISSRCSQKGVVGGIVPNNQLPTVVGGVYDGLQPDITFSPMSLTSRATPEIVLEIHLGKHSLVTGQTVDATAFSMNPGKFGEVSEVLVQAGHDPSFYHTFRDKDGHVFQAYMGPCYIRVLEQTSYEKLKACSHIAHSVNKLTRQPARGGLTGGLQEGTMELDTFIAHSLSQTVQQLYCRQADRVLVKLCRACGHYNDKLGLQTPSAEALLLRSEEACARCGEKALVTTETSYGAVRAYYQMLTAGVRLALFPEQTAF